MEVTTLRRGPRTQTLICGDLLHEETHTALREALPERVCLVYSDPPWTLGIATYWRTHAGLERCESYPAFCDAWVRAFSGTDLVPGDCVIDPCTGKGRTSRVAHCFDLDFVGIELNPKRLAVTIDWLRRQGYP